MQQFSELPPLSLYIHIPWCVAKCPYCDFNSHVTEDKLPQRQYVSTLLDDLDHQLQRIWGRSIISIFIGGGTPSLFDPDALDQLLSGLRARLNFAPSVEISMEANPGTVEQGKFNEFKAIGINRISIGAQSFNDQHLQALGRIHRAREGIKAVEAAHYAGFERINIDLMYGLPQQNSEQAKSDLYTALALEPNHISHYQLTLEPNTFFHVHPPELPDEERIDAIEIVCRDLLAQHDYKRYEISAYAKDGHRCQHNLNYWQFGDYLGIGAGAHSKITDAARQQIDRHWVIKNPRIYLEKRDPQQRIGAQHQLKRDEVGFEFMLNACRLIDGFESALFQRHTGLPISTIADRLERAQEKNLIDWDVKRIQPTEFGLQYLNDLTELFLPQHHAL